MNLENRFLNKNMLKALENQLRCRICSEFYNNCVMAICSHNFCSVCIKKRLTTEGDCPCCFEVIQESDLRSNRILDKLVRFYKKMQRNSNKGNMEIQNQMISHSQVQRDSHIPKVPDMQMTCVQSSDNLPNCAASQNSPLNQSFQTNLIDLTHPIKIEIVESNESSMNDVVMSTNSARNSVGSSIPELPLELNDAPRIYSLLTNIYQRLVKLQNEVKEVKNNQVQFFNMYQVNNEPEETAANLLELPKELVLPIASDTNLIQLNKFLEENKNQQLMLIRYLNCTCSGKSKNTFILSLLRKLMTKDLAMEYSRLGRKGKKSFENLPALLCVIIATASKRFSEVSRQELAVSFGKVLASAADWDGRKSRVLEEMILS